MREQTGMPPRTSGSYDSLRWQPVNQPLRLSKRPGTGETEALRDPSSLNSGRTLATKRSLRLLSCEGF